jgi:putative ABC transport system permease protein
MPAVPTVVRELGRRRIRSALTAAGIAIGVAALVLLGSLAEKMGRLVDGGRDFAMGQITVSGAGSGGAPGGMLRGALLSGEQLAALPKVDGVKAVAPIVIFPASDGPPPLPFTLAPMVFGVDLVLLWQSNAVAPPTIAVGRLIPKPDSNEVVIGCQVARTFAATVGSVLTIRGKEFSVAGVLEPTLTGPDSFVFMPFTIAEQLLVESDPMLRKMALVPGSNVLPVATAAAVLWRPDQDPETLAARIRSTVPGVSALSPGEAGEQIDRALVFMRALILGSAVVALLVAALAVANTMVTAIVERRREIGLRRVVGATRGQVVRLLVGEATVLGAVGAIAGTLGGAAAAAALNVVTERLGAPVFLVTPRLVVAAIVLPSLLAALAGLVPARRAARLLPAVALRYV